MKQINDKLNVASCEQHRFMEALRMLSNAYKHDVEMQPDDNLLKALNLETGVPYMPIPESPAIREGFAVLLGLPPESNFSEIADAYVDIAKDFLEAVKGQTQMSKVSPSKLSLHPDTYGR